MADCSSSRCVAELKNSLHRHGDQFINLSEGRTQHPDRARHFGLVVDDKEKIRRQLKEAGVETLPGRGVEFRDPWENCVQVVSYANIQFTKHKAVLDGWVARPTQSARSYRGTARKGIAVKEN